MPLYDLQCLGDCGVQEDVFLNLFEADNPLCPECGSKATLLVAPVRTVGPMTSKPLVMNQLGRTFETPAQLREYKKKNPDAHFYQPNDSTWVRYKDRIRENAERKAKKKGFRDLEDQKVFQKERTKETKRKAAGG